MRWRMGRRSRNIEDRRGVGGPGGFGRLARPGRGRAVGLGGGLGAALFILVALLLGVDPGLLLQGGTTRYAPGPPAPEQAGAPDELSDFVAVVLGDTEDTWRALFADEGLAYEEPRLVLFSDAVRSGCGFAGAQVGPFYCPADGKIYLDLSFFDELARRFGAPGDFAQAYVVAHEVGHHVQSLLGIAAEVRAAQSGASRAQANALSVMMELQADCFAGIWAHHADRSRQILEAGDIEEGLNAASAIGDDRLQRRSRGYVAPDSFTHGSSAQRVRWFRTGFESGDLAACNTFAAEAP